MSKPDLCSHGSDLNYVRCDRCMNEEAKAKCGVNPGPCKSDKVAASTSQSDEFSFFDIDRYKLDEEWASQPKRVYDHGCQLAEARADHERAKSARDVAKDELEEITARLKLDMRKSPDKYSLPKTTEDTFKEAVLLQAEYKDAQQKVYDAVEKIIVTQLAVGTLESAMTAFEHKKKGIGDTVWLHSMMYYAEPQVRGNDTWNKKMDKAFKPMRKSK